MTYSSFSRLPALSTHQQAAERLAQIKPLRGRLPAVYPLHERRYADKFAIRKVGDAASKPQGTNYRAAPAAVDGDIELLLYGQPSITFHQDDTITLSNRWTTWSAADTAFCQEILYRYIHSANRTGKKHGYMLVIEPSASLMPTPKIVIPSGGDVQLRLDHPSRTLRPLEPIVHKAHRISRKKANIVRQRYAPFYRYMKGMVSLRTEIKDDSKYGTQKEKRIIYVSHNELMGVIGAYMTDEVPTTSTYVGKLDYTKAPILLQKPPVIAISQDYDHETRKWSDVESSDLYANWTRHMENFIGWISTPEEHPDHAINFSTAFSMLLVQQMFGSHPVLRHQTRHIATDMVMHADPDRVATALEEILFKWHSDEVFEYVELHEGKVPNRKYEDWKIGRAHV